MTTLVGVRFWRPALLTTAFLVAVAGCGGTSPADPTAAHTAAVSATAATTAVATASATATTAAETAASAASPSGDWTRFDFDAARSGVGPANTGITSRNLGQLRVRHVRIDGTVDSSPIELAGIRARGRTRDLVFVTTTYGRTIAIDAGSGGRVWEYSPPGVHRLEGTAQITNTTPVADPDRRYLYAASPDGVIRKLSVATGHEVRSAHWPVRVTRLPSVEKLGGALNLSGSQVIVATGGYVGDSPPYQGHVVTIDRSSGRILHVWNSLCANRHAIISPSSCPVSGSAIWARSGVVVDPRNGRLLVTTGNQKLGAPVTPFDGRLYWDDSVLELTPDAASLLQNWTPRNHEQLSRADLDLGSTAPALLPTLSGRHLAVQGGKAGTFALLDVDRLNGTTRAGRRTGGELATLSDAGVMLTAPAVWSHAGADYIAATTGASTTLYRVAAGSLHFSRLTRVYNPGTSPVLAGGLLYVYDPGGTLRIYDPQTLHREAALSTGGGHWNSPIVIGGRIIVPTGNANDHSTRGNDRHLPPAGALTERVRRLAPPGRPAPCQAVIAGSAGPRPASAPAGRTRMNVLPAPSSLSTSIRPPWATAISQQIASPRPLPPDSRERERSAR